MPRTDACKLGTPARRVGRASDLSSVAEHRLATSGHTELIRVKYYKAFNAATPFSQRLDGGAVADFVLSRAK